MPRQDMTVLYSASDRITRARLVMKLNQQELADLAGVTKTCISHLECRAAYPPMLKFERICTALGLSMTIVLDPESTGYWLNWSAATQTVPQTKEVNI